MKRVRRAKRLPERTRETIALARLAGYSIETIARMMDLPRSTVSGAHLAKPLAPEVRI